MSSSSIFVFNARADHICKQLTCDVVVRQNGKSAKYLAMWDTGATITGISQRVCDDLKLKHDGTSTVGHAGGREESSMHTLDIELPNEYAIPNLRVLRCKTLPPGIDVLIGMDIITLGDFAISNHRGKTTYAFRIPSLGTIEY